MFGVNVCFDLFYGLGKGGVDLHLFLDFFNGVEYGGVIPIAEEFADIVRREVCHGADQIHCHLPGIGGLSYSLLAADHLLTDAVVL